MKHTILILAILAAMILPFGAMADAILLTNGKIINGIVIMESTEQLVVQTGRSKLTIPMDSIRQRFEESPLAYHLRLGEEALLTDDYQTAERELQLVLEADADNNRAQTALAETKILIEILKEEGAEGIARLKEKRRLLEQGDEMLLNDDIDGALSSYLQYFELQQDDWRILVEIAEIYRQKALAKFYLPPSEEKQYAQFAQQPVTDSQIEFFDTTDAENLQVLKSAKEQYAPLAYLRKAPFSVSVFREIHKADFELYNMIYYLERLSRLPDVRQELLLPDASLQQWFNVVQLIQEQQKAYYRSLRQLSEQEAMMIQKAFLARQADLKQREIDWMWTTVRGMVDSGQWGFSMASALTYLKRLNPGADMLSAIEAYEKQNDAKLRELRRFNATANRPRELTGTRRRPRVYHNMGTPSARDRLRRNWGLIDGNVFIIDRF